MDAETIPGTVPQAGLGLPPITELRAIIEGLRQTAIELGFAGTTKQLARALELLEGGLPASQTQADTALVAKGEQFDFHAHLARQAAFSLKTFGPGMRTNGVCDHIRKELLEIEADPTDLGEWVDVVILGLDGAWRCGGTPEQIIAGIIAKQTKNEGRTWPDWRTADPSKAIEHDRSGEVATSRTTEGHAIPGIWRETLEQIEAEIHFLLALKFTEPATSNGVRDAAMDAHEVLTKHCVPYLENGQPMSLVARIDELYSWYYSACRPESPPPASDEVRNQALDEAVEACLRAVPDRARIRAIGEAGHYSTCADAIRALKKNTAKGE